MVNSVKPFPIEPPRKIAGQAIFAAAAGFIIEGSLAETDGVSAYFTADEGNLTGVTSLGLAEAHPQNSLFAAPLPLAENVLGDVPNDVSLIALLLERTQTEETNWLPGTIDLSRNQTPLASPNHQGEGSKASSAVHQRALDSEADPIKGADDASMVMPDRLRITHQDSSTTHKNNLANLSISYSSGSSTVENALATGPLEVGPIQAYLFSSHEFLFLAGGLGGLFAVSALRTDKSDKASPTAQLSLSDESLLAGETATVTIRFSEAVSGFSLADLVADSGSLSDLSDATVNADGSVSYTARFTPSVDVADTSNVIGLLAGSYRDVAGNLGGSAQSGNYVVDTKLPTAQLSLSDESLLAGETATVTIRFSEAVSGFSLADLVADSGSLSDLSDATVNADGSVSYTARFTPSVDVADTSNVIGLLAGSYRDVAGNLGGSAQSGNYVVDTKLPTAQLSLSDESLLAGETATVTIRFSEAVSGFSLADLVADSGSLSDLSDATVNADGSVSYTARFTPSVDVADTSNVIGLLAGSYRDVAGNLGGSAQSGNYVVDTKLPTAQLSLSDESLLAGETATVTIRFSEAVSGFSLADLVADSGSLSDLSDATVNADGSVSYTARFTPSVDVADTSNVIGLLAGSYRDVAGNLGGSAQSGNYVVDTKLPTAQLSLSDESLLAGETATVTIRFSEAVSGFSLADLVADSGSLSDLSDATVNADGSVSYTARFTPSVDVADTSNVIGLLAGSYRDVAGNLGGSAQSGNYVVDTKLPTAQLSLSDESLLAGETATVTIRFSEAVSGFSLADLVADSGSLSDLSDATVNADGSVSYTARFTPSVDVLDTKNVITLNLFGVSDTSGNIGIGTALSGNYVVATKQDGGVVADGYISGATIFRDLDGDGKLSAGEASVLSGLTGKFSGLSGFGGTIVALGGTDISTGLQFQGILKAPPGSTVVNPLTTLVAAVMGGNVTFDSETSAALVAQAEQRVAELLGISAAFGSLTSTDPLSVAATGGQSASDAINVQLKAIQVANLLVTATQSLLSSGVASSLEVASKLVNESLGSVIGSTATGQAFSLSDASVINSVLTNALSKAIESGQVAQSSPSVFALFDLSDDIAASLSAVNARIDSLASSNEGLGALTKAVATQLAVLDPQNGLLRKATDLLDSLSTALSDALRNGQTIDLQAIAAISESVATSLGTALSSDFSGVSLDAIITDKLDEVKDIFGSGGTDTTPGGGGTDTTPGGGGTDTTPGGGGTDTTPGGGGTDTTPGGGGTDTTPGGGGTDTTPGGGGTDTTLTVRLGDVLDNIGSHKFWASNLDVKLGLQEADFTDGGAGGGDGDGTVTLNASLAELQALGIDRITAVGGPEGKNIVVKGLGAFDFGSNQPAFDQGLGVKLELQETDFTDGGAGGGDGDGTVTLNASLAELQALGIDRITAVGGPEGKNIVVKGLGAFDFGSNQPAFDQGLGVKLELQETDFTDGGAGGGDGDGTVTLNASLAELQALGIDQITAVGGPEVKNIVVKGLGAFDFGSNQPAFDQGLGVKLELQETDFTDGGAGGGHGDGTVTLNASLAELQALGIDQITAVGGPEVKNIVVKGLGAFDFGSNQPAFDQGLGVKLELQETDFTDGGAGGGDGDGTVTLNASLAELQALGIDQITADGGPEVKNIVVKGLGAFDFGSNQPAFDQGFNVTIANWQSEGSSLLSDQSKVTLQKLGIDHIGDGYDLFSL